MFELILAVATVLLVWFFGVCLGYAGFPTLIGAEPASVETLKDTQKCDERLYMVFIHLMTDGFEMVTQDTY